MKAAFFGACGAASLAAGAAVVSAAIASGAFSAMAMVVANIVTLNSDFILSPKPKRLTSGIIAD
ncbi:hypothetical protein [Pantoea septica]|uniref:hypothetical protein n=1 Tax=Pantoea septica TaxID=472695 RepID=UPI0028A82DD2|nr:hypothetical protein [Pantoea septica]